MVQSVIFPSRTVKYIFDSPIEELWLTYNKSHVVIVTNELIAKLYYGHFKGVKMLVIPQGENTKDLHTIGSLARQLLDLQATRQIMLIGVGGGVITDIVGFLASVYLRGVKFGFVPTTLLGMVDAAIGGKNGVNSGMHKNIIGTINQPEFILFDSTFLNTLADDEWSNGFAEIIKCACIFDAELFDELSSHNISYYKNENDEALKTLIVRCVGWKTRTVQEDELEKANRKLLNFGHTAAHAIENLYELPHGKAVGIGMVIASMISVQVTGLNKDATEQLKAILGQYHLPVKLQFNAARAMEMLKMDKKRVDETIDYILLERIGKAVIHALPFDTIEKALMAYESNN